MPGYFAVEAEEQSHVAVKSEDGANMLSSWLKKRAKGNLTTELQPESQQLWELPPDLTGRQDLPPSLQPIIPESFTTSEFEEWGW